MIENICFVWYFVFNFVTKILFFSKQELPNCVCLKQEVENFNFSWEEEVLNWEISIFCLRKVHARDIKILWIIKITWIILWRPVIPVISSVESIINCENQIFLFSLNAFYFHVKKIATKFSTFRDIFRFCFHRNNINEEALSPNIYQGIEIIYVLCSFQRKKKLNPIQSCQSIWYTRPPFEISRC